MKKRRACTGCQGEGFYYARGYPSGRAARVKHTCLRCKGTKIDPFKDDAEEKEHTRKQQRDVARGEYEALLERVEKAERAVEKIDEERSRDLHAMAMGLGTRTS